MPTRTRGRDWITGSPACSALRILAGRTPDPYLIYETALREGVVFECLPHAEAFSAESARLAEPHFPRWAAFQEACPRQARKLQGDHEKLAAETRRA